MFGKAWAASLILLILSPFTAPFSTCDVSTLLNAPSKAIAAHDIRLPKRRVVNDAQTTTVPALARQIGRIRLDFIATAPVPLTHSVRVTAWAALGLLLPLERTPVQAGVLRL